MSSRGAGGGSAFTPAPRPQEALSALRGMFADGEIESQGVAAAVLDTDGLASAKPGLVDRLIQGGYGAAGGSMATFEKASGKLKSVSVL